MPNRPKPRPTPTPKAFDVFKPGKGRPSPTSRPVIVSSHPQVQDSTVVEKHGAPVANAHHVAAPTPPDPAPANVSAPQRPKPVLKSLQSLPHPASSPAPHASSMHVPVAHHAKPAVPAPATDETTVEATPKKVSRHGVTIAPPSASAAHKIRPVSDAAKPPAAATKPTEPAEPNLAAVPITPMEQPSGPESKVEGKEELLAAMPIEIRRTIASTTGQQASEWNVPDFSSAAPTAAAAPAPASQEQAAPAAPVPAEAAPAPADKPAPPAAEQAPSEPVAPPDAASPEQSPAVAPASTKPDTPTQPMSSSQAAKVAEGKNRRSEAAVFIIMFVLFLLLGTLVVLLFLSGSIAI